MVDARIDKDFRFSDFDLNLSVDGFNLTNENYLLQRERNAGTRDRCNTPNEGLSPRIFRLGATLRFR